MSIRPSISYQKAMVTGATMGTQFSAIFYVEQGYDASKIANKLQAAVTLVDNQMSNWKANSDLTKFNNTACNIWTTIPEDMFYVIESALNITKKTNGAFDIAVGNMVNAWGFGPAHSSPNAQDIKQLSQQDNGNILDVLKLDAANSSLCKSAPLMLDLCGIAKGYGVDKLAEILNAANIDNYLVSIDGEMRAKGTKPNTEYEDAGAWNVAIEQPIPEIRDIARVIKLENAAIATSGDYRHLHEFNNQIISHTIDKNTQAPLVNNIASLSIIAQDCMHADAYATACMVMGEAKGIEFARKNQLNALFIIRDGLDFRQIATGIFEQK